jgi:hypothetical protein
VSKSIREALQYVARHPEPTEAPLDMPVWEHIGRALFDIANNPDPRVRGAMARATRAQSMILDRTVGRRRAGTKPVRPSRERLTFVDLTGGAIER